MGGRVCSEGDGFQAYRRMRVLALVDHESWRMLVIITVVRDAYCIDYLTSSIAS